MSWTEEAVNKLSQGDNIVNVLWEVIPEIRTGEIENDILAEIESFIVKEKVDVNKPVNGSHPLAVACVYDNKPIINLLIRHGADPDTKKADTFIMEIADNIDDLILKMYFTVEHKNYAPAFNIVKNGHLDILKNMVNVGLNINDLFMNRRLLAIACEYGWVDIIEWLIDNGASIDGTHVLNSPLYMACRKNQIDVVDILLANGCNVNTKLYYNLDGKGLFTTPLFIASSEGFLSIIDRLVVNGADIHMVDVEGETSLFMAVYNKQLAAAEKLIEYGVDINKCGGHEMMTPLMIAAKNSDMEMVLMLLDMGADPTIKTVKEKTAWHYASDPEIKAVLEKANIICHV